MSLIEVKGLRKSFGSLEVLNLMQDKSSLTVRKSPQKARM